MSTDRRDRGIARVNYADDPYQIMASLVLPRWRTVFRASWRCYGYPPHNKTTPHYLSYRKGLTRVRKQFMEELQLEKKMMTEDFNSQAAQEARKEREREALALEENEKELKRMAEKRYEHFAVDKKNFSVYSTWSNSSLAALDPLLTARMYLVPPD